MPPICSNRVSTSAPCSVHGPCPLETTMIYLHLTQKGKSLCSASMKIMRGLTSCLLLPPSSPPTLQSISSAIPILPASHHKALDAICHAEPALYAIASLPAKLWTTSSHRSCLWQSARSAVSASESGAVVAQPTRYTAARAVLPDHLHRARSATTLLPLTSPAGVPGPVLGFITGSQTPRQRATLHWHNPARFHRHPAYLGPTTAISSSHPLHRPWRWTLTGVRHGCLQEPTSMSPCEPCRRSSALSSNKRCAPPAA